MRQDAILTKLQNFVKPYVGDKVIAPDETRALPLPIRWGEGRGEERLCQDF
jgi:hypothetical protein